MQATPNIIQKIVANLKENQVSSVAMFNAKGSGGGFDFKTFVANTWQKLKGLGADTSHRVQLSLANDDNAKLYSAIAYIPFAGPLIVFLFKRSQRLSLIHAQNASYLQITLVVIIFAVWLLENLPIVSAVLSLIRFVPFVTDAVSYLAVVSFISFSAIGAYNGYKGHVWVVPFLNDFINNIIYRKNDLKKLDAPKEN